MAQPTSFLSPPAEPPGGAQALIEISIADQLLRITSGGACHLYPVSTAANGAGEQEGSEKTPRGWHRVRACVGDGMPLNTVFRGRRVTGEIYSPELAAQFPRRDWILTRILWLQGLEVGYNRMGGVDSMRRYIYIHGTPDSEPVGVPRSHGCIRMRNEDVRELSGLIRAETLVWIQEHSFSRIPCLSV